MLGLVRQRPHQDLTQPGDELPLARARELCKLSVRLQERFLDQVGRIELDLERRADQRTGQEPEIIAVQFQQPAQRSLVASAGPNHEQTKDRTDSVIDDP